MIWILLGIIVALLCYIYLIRPHKYWRDKGVAQSNPAYIFGDNWEQVIRRASVPDSIKRHYRDAGDRRIYGIYQGLTPILMIKDLQLLKQITVKDFDYFQDHRQFLPENTDPLWEGNLFALRGQKWKDMRATLSPAFTSSKMRTIFVLVSECAERVTEHFLAKKDAELENLEMKDLFTRFANDVIASVAFGIKCDSLRQRTNTFYMMGKAATDFGSFLMTIKFMTIMVIPKVAGALKLTIFSEKVKQFFRDIVTRTIKMREEKNIVRSDMIQLLMEARKNGLKYEEEHAGAEDAGFATVHESEIGRSNKHITYKLTDDDITAQGLIFFLAGFDTVSSAMNFAAYELATNPDVQDRLLQEVEATLDQCNGQLTYEALMKMKYLDMVMSETLRKWPPAPAADRLVTKPYVIQPIEKNEQPVQLDVNDVLWIPIVGLHYDPQYFPEPEKFDPERFSDENKATIKPYTYLPFGSGPRNCIGSRFALLEAKTVLFHLISKFQFVVTEKTQIPLELSKKSFNMNSDKGTWIGFKRRSKTN